MINKFTAKVDGMKKSHKTALTVLLVLVLIAILASVATSANATRYPPITNYDGQDSGNGNNSNGEDRRGISNALCLGMTNFDYDRGMQVSAGGSWWQDENSGCVALGTMVDEVLIVGGGACDTGMDDCGGAVSFSMHF